MFDLLQWAFSKSCMVWHSRHAQRYQQKRRPSRFLQALGVRRSAFSRIVIVKNVTAAFLEGAMAEGDQPGD
jgi:hypothetical protein